MSAADLPRAVDDVLAVTGRIVERIDPTRIGTHSPDCALWHAECLALVVDQRLRAAREPYDASRPHGTPAVFMPARGTIAIVDQEDGTTVNVTPDEARTLAGMLTEAAFMVDQAGRS